MKNAAIGIILFVFSVSLFSLELDALNALDDSEFPLTHNIEWKTGDEPELELLPEIFGAERLRQRFSEIRPEISVEKMYRISLEPENLVSSEEIFLKLANIFGNPETQTKYLYERGRRKEKTALIQEAYICNEEGDELAPLRFSLSDIPGTFEYYQYANERIFSGMVVRVFLDITEDFFYVNIENAESMKFAIFPLIPKESIFVYNFLFVHNNMLYAYSITQLLEDVKIKRVGPYIINPANMIGRRMDIMASWVRGEFLSSSVLP